MASAATDRKAELRERLNASREAFLSAVAALGEAELAASVGHASDWTAKDLIGHVSYAEASMLPMIQGALADTAPGPNPDFDLDRWNDGRVRRARAQSVGDLLARLEGSRAQCLALLDGLADADLDRPTYHPSLKQTTVAGVFGVIADHERDHAGELRTLTAGKA